MQKAFVMQASVIVHTSRSFKRMPVLDTPDISHRIRAILSREFYAQGICGKSKANETRSSRTW